MGQSLGARSPHGYHAPARSAGTDSDRSLEDESLHQPWNGGETLSVAIGQGYVLTTAIQLANLYASIANGGTLYRPYLVKEIESNDGKILKEYQPEVVDQTRLKEKTYELVKQGLWNVVNTPHGTAYSQRLAGMDFVGKTAPPK